MVVPAMSTRPTCSGTVFGARQHIVPFKTPHSSIQAAIWRQRTSIAQEPVSRTVVVTKATRDARFAYQKDIQTKLRPGDFADREDNKSNHLSAAQDWQTVVKLFYELGDNLDRNISLVGDMLVSLQRLLPPPASSSSSSGRLSADESNVLAAGIMNICSVLVENIQKVNNNLLINVIWALALLPDPAKTVKTPAAAAARARCVGVFGAAVLNRMSRYTAEEVFHVGAGLAMLGFKPPRTLQSDRAVTTFGALVERRTVKVMHYLSPKAIADAGYVAARLVAPGDMSEEWLKLFAYVSRQHISTMQPEALIYTGYALARHGFKPSNTWRKRYMDGIFGFSKTLEGEEFPMVLFTLAKWQQQQQQQQGSTEDDLEGGDDLDFQQQSLSSSSSSSGAFTTSSSGPQPSQTLINNLLLASHTNRALKQLPLNQIVVMLKSLTELDCYISPQWMQRLWPVINAQIDAAADDNASTSSSSSSSGALSSNLAALLVTIPKLNPKPDLPGDFLDIAVGNLGLGLDQLIQQNPRDLAAAWAALQQLHYTPDQIFMRQMQQAVMQGMSNVACKDLDALLQLGIAAASSSSGVAAAAEQYAQQMLQGFCDEVQDRVGLVTGDTAVPAAAAAAGGVGRIALQWQQQQERRQQLISNAAAEGLWRLPQTLNVCIDVLSAAAAVSSSSSSNSALSSFHVQLQQIWRQAAVGLASVMPTEPLLVLLNFLLDLESNKQQQQQQQLGLTNAADRQQLTLDILRSGVYNHIAASSSSSSSRGRKSATAAAAAGSSADQQQQQMKKDLLVDFSVADWQELLVIIADAGLQDTAPDELLTLASESLHKALNELPKAKTPSEDMSEEEYSANESILAAIDTFLAQQLVDELVITLKQDYGFSLPAKVKAKYKTVKQLIGQEVPIELTQKSSRKKAAASSISSKVPKAPAAAPAAAAAIRESIVAKPTPAAAIGPAAAVAAPDSDVVATPSQNPSSSDGLVRSNRSRSRSSTGV